MRSYLLGADEPHFRDAVFRDLIDGSSVQWCARHPEHDFLIDHLVAEDHAIDELGMKVWEVEAVVSIVHCQGSTADEDWIRVGHAIDEYVFGVFTHEALQITSVVGVELALCERLGVE